MSQEKIKETPMSQIKIKETPYISGQNKRDILYLRTVHHSNEFFYLPN
jgi:hypothetical protein